MAQPKRLPKTDESEHCHLFHVLFQQIHKVVLEGLIFWRKETLLEHKHGNLFVGRFSNSVVHLHITNRKSSTYSPAIMRTTRCHGLLLDNIGFIHLATEGYLHHTFQHPISFSVHEYVRQGNNQIRHIFCNRGKGPIFGSFSHVSVLRNKEFNQFYFSSFCNNSYSHTIFSIFRCWVQREATWSRPTHEIDHTHTLFRSVFCAFL